MHSLRGGAQAKVWALEKLLSPDPTSLENLQGSRTVGELKSQGESRINTSLSLIKIWKFRGDQLP